MSPSHRRPSAMGSKAPGREVVSWGGMQEHRLARRCGSFLVAENQDLLRVESDLLQRHRGWFVVSAGEEVEEGLRKARDLRPHVVVLDLDRPCTDGLRTILDLREQLPDVHIIGLTVAKGSAHGQAALSAGANAMVCKSEMVRDLPPAIHRAAWSRGIRWRRMNRIERRLRGRSSRSLGVVCVWPEPGGLDARPRGPRDATMQDILDCSLIRATGSGRSTPGSGS